MKEKVKYWFEFLVFFVLISILSLSGANENWDNFLED